MSAMSKDQINASLFDRVKELETEAAALRAERDELQEELDEWRFTNAVDVLRRERDGLKDAADRLSNRAHELECHIESLQDVVSALGKERDELAAWKSSVEQAEPVAWAHSDGRVIPASTMSAAQRDGGAMRSSVRGYTIKLIAHPAPAAAPEQAEPCRCRRCLTERGDLLTLASTMILCPTCGNKRCPHATDHRHACTGSNEPGQPGSCYGGLQVYVDAGKGDSVGVISTRSVMADGTLSPWTYSPVSAAADAPGVREKAFADCMDRTREARRKMIPCRCGPDGCSDSVACPKKGGAT